MPIRPEHRKLYGRAWRAFRLELIATRGETCENCKIELAAGLNGAHTNHDPRDQASVRLWCPSCHARHDARHRIAIMRRNRARETAQLWLWPELEWAPFAAWEIPAWIWDRMNQLKLFDV